MSRNLFGMHDPGNWEEIVRQAGRQAWCVHTEAVGSDPNDTSGKNFSRSEITPIVRLNNGYGSTGTIPSPDQYANFATRCANFVAASTGCRHWIIGNEIALQWEWPNNEPITLSNYIKCYNLVYRSIHRVQPDAIVMPQPPAPWNPSTPDAPDWVDQLARMLREVESVDGIALHAYTHGHDAGLISSDQTMNPPYDKYHYHFRCYRDFMSAIPTKWSHLPVYITECNPDGWENVNNGWIQAAYAEIASWNHDNHQQIVCLAFYRWPDEDREQFHIGSKGEVVNDFRAALSIDLRPVDHTSETKTRVKALTTLNVRRTPGTSNKDSFDILTMLREGETAVLVSDQKVEVDKFLWVQIQTSSGSGYIALRHTDGTQMGILVP